jgi:SAM-dependent methyltransferase
MTPPGDWWRTFFHGVALDLWRAAVPPEVSRQDADFLARTLQVAPPARILDVPCGNGRVSLVLAGEGYQVTGVDLAEEFIAEAKRQVKERKLPAEYQQGDMRQLLEGAGFDGAFCWGNSFGYLDDAGNADFLRSVGRAVKPGARLVLETGVLAESLLPHLPGKVWYEVGDILMLVDNHYDPARGRLDTEFVFIRDGKVDRRPSTSRVYTYRELSSLLEAAGFAVEEAFGGTDGSPYRTGDRVAIFVSTRR